MRLRLVIALLATALVAAACGGSGGADEATPAEAAAVPEIVQAEPVLEEYRGKPLAVVFFHPL
jgi:ABC-type glycerol-3-phosphate transport system substrate-binding protein